MYLGAPCAERSVMGPIGVKLLVAARTWPPPACGLVIVLTFTVSPWQGEESLYCAELMSQYTKPVIVPAATFIFVCAALALPYGEEPVVRGVACVLEVLGCVTTGGCCCAVTIPTVISSTVAALTCFKISANPTARLMSFTPVSLLLPHFPDLGNSQAPYAIVARCLAQLE